MFLKDWHKDDTFFVFLLNINTGENKTFKHTIESFEKYESTIEKYNDEGYNVYYTVNSFYKDSKVRRKDTVETIKSIWFDVDTPDTAEEIYNKITKRFGKPTYRIRTSKGKFQILYKLKKPLKATERNKFIVESTMKLLAQYFETDMATTGIQQIFRLPGYKNMKYNNMNSYVERKTNNEFDLLPFIKFANKIKTEKVFDKKIDKFKLQNIDIKVNRYEGITDYHKGIYYNLLKKMNQDASRADIPYIRNRKKSGVSFDVVMKEISELREHYGCPFKRNFSSYYSDRLNLYNDM